MTTIEVKHKYTIVANTESITERIVASAIRHSQLVSLSEFLSEHSLKSRELSPDVIVLHDVQHTEIEKYIEASRKALKLGYQRIFFRSGLDVNARNGSVEDSTPVELDVGIYKWMMPYVPAMINMGPGVMLVDIALRYENDRYFSNTPYWFAKNFVTDCQSMGSNLDSNLLSIYDSIDWEKSISTISIHGAGRNAERKRIVEFLFTLLKKDESDGVKRAQLIDSPYTEELTKYCKEKGYEPF